jgi:citrate lyase subunit beta/citryl-CoA lyase
LLDQHLTRLEAEYGFPQGATQIMLLATELPESLLQIGSYAGLARLCAMAWSAEDLAAALGASDNRGPFGGYDFPYVLARSLCLIGAAAANAAPIETIYADFRDEAGLRARVAYARRQGFRGMLAIHPVQVDAIHEGFAPSADEIAAAQEIADLFAANPGAGVLALKGAMLDAPHLARAKAVLALAEAFKPR